MQRYATELILSMARTREYSGGVAGERETGVDRQRPYHHGNLRRAVLDEAIDVIGEAGPGAIRLRDLARRAGVSHAAPTHHFGDKRGLLTALAADGFGRLAGELDRTWAATGSFLEVGVAYVRFALANRPYFEV